MNHIGIRDLTRQWLLAGIWMIDANKHSMPLCEIKSRDVARKMLDEYFDMVEQNLEQRSSSGEPPYKTAEFG